MRPSKALERSRTRNYFIFRMRGIIPLLGNTYNPNLELDYEELEAIAAAYKALRPLLDKWDRERKSHPRNCQCNTCYTRKVIKGEL